MKIYIPIYEPLFQIYPDFRNNNQNYWICNWKTIFGILVLNVIKSVFLLFVPYNSILFLSIK